MLIWNHPYRLLLWSFLLCCAGFALGQSVENNATGSALPDELSNATVSSRISTSVDSPASSLSMGSALSNSVAVSASLPSSMASVQGSANTVRGLRPATGLTRESRKLEGNRITGSKTAQTIQSNLPGEAGLQLGTTNETAIGQPSLRAAGFATYTEDFPDSTKGTALLSPPDRGTQSPLDWSTGVNYGFPDFSQQQFLNPSLHVSRHQGRALRAKGSLQGRRRIHPLGRQQQNDLYTLPSSSLDQGLKTEGLPQSILKPPSDLLPLQQ